jgi:hypothetical protein
MIPCYNLVGLYSTTKASLKVEVCTTLIQSIYIISLSNVRLLTHKLLIMSLNKISNDFQFSKKN